MTFKSPLLRFLFGHCVIGGGAGLMISAALLYFDAAGIATLSMKSEPTWLGPFLLCFSFFASFSSFAMGVAVMAFGGENKGDGGSGDGLTTQHRLVPDVAVTGEISKAAVKSSK